MALPLGHLLLEETSTATGSVPELGKNLIAMIMMRLFIQEHMRCVMEKITIVTE